VSDLVVLKAARPVVSGTTKSWQTQDWTSYNALTASGDPVDPCVFLGENKEATQESGLK
jgi:hypothetical protein